MSNVPFGGPPPELVRGNYVPARNVNKPTTTKPQISAPRVKSLTPSSSRERISPMPVSPKTRHTPPVKNAVRPKPVRLKDPRQADKFHDYLLGFIIGLAIFGISSIFICSAVIELFI